MHASNGKEVLVTGAFGNLGQMVLAELRSAGYRIHAMDLDNTANRRTAKRIKHLWDTVAWGDIRQLDFSQLVKDKCAVIHLAAILPPGTENNPALSHAVNVQATFNIVEAIESSEVQPLLIYPSSVTVFGDPQGERLRHAGEPAVGTDHYTQHKVEVEQRLEKGNLPWCVLRVGVSVDARTLSADPGTLKQLFMVRADNPLEYVHPRDVATAIVHAIEAPEAQSKILLLGGGANCQVDQLGFLSTAFNALGIALPRDIFGTNSFYTHWMDTAESQRILKFQRHSFADYQREMQQRLGWLRPLIRPLSPLVIWGLKRWLNKA